MPNPAPVGAKLRSYRQGIITPIWIAAIIVPMYMLEANSIPFYTQLFLQSLRAEEKHIKMANYLDLPVGPADIAFGLMADFENDSHPKKVSLIAGAYRNENGDPWVLPSVKEVGNSSRIVKL